MKYSELITQSKQEISVNKNRAEKLSNLNQQQLSWQPARGKWSIAQCLEHLNIVSRHYLKHMNYENARKAADDKEFKPSFFGGFLAKNFAIIPPKRRFKTTRSFSPENNMNGQDVLKDFLSNQGKMMQLTDKASGYDLNKNKVPSPATRLLRFRFGDVLNMDGKHTARHLHQIDNVIKAEGFPK